MVARTRGRWWLNTPWYTDWALWVGVALVVAGVVSNAMARAGAGGGTSERDVYFSHGAALWVSGVGDAVADVILGFVAYVVPPVLLRGLCRAIFRVPPGPLGPRTLRVPFHGVGVQGAVVYTRNRDGKVTARVEGLPPARRAEALAITRERAARAGFVSTSAPHDAIGVAVEQGRHATRPASGETIPSRDGDDGEAAPGR